MANQVKIDLSLQDGSGSIKKRTGEVQTLNKELTRAQQLAKSSGSGAVKAGYNAGAENTAYGQARGSMGSTGASGRDFANQAQGLGGLVRLYATYAANVFAVSAAFSALSNAMNTTNMVQGLNQLGAASGVAMGNLAKQFAQASGGAISLREAMEATAKAVSSGLSQDQFLKLGEVAKKASQALGVGMSDAVSRLTRGITKLEPELLDELGIFTKVGKATEDYAQSIGKSALALTDFERRQAFANAVLAEGSQKFGEIDIPTNPYDKLIASLKNVAQSILEVVNKALVPLVDILSASPTALLAAVAVITAKITTQALPAITQYRQGLNDSATAALKAAQVFKESFGDEFQTRLEQQFKIPDLQAGVAKAQADLNKLEFKGKKPASIKALESGDYSEKKINSLLETRNKIVSTGMSGSKKASDTTVANAKEEIKYIEKLIDLYRKKQALEQGYGGAQSIADKPANRFDPEVIALKRYQDLRQQVDRANAVSNAAENARIIGITGAWTLLNKEVEEKGTKGIDKYTTLAKGGMAAVSSRILGVVGALGNVGMVIGVVIGAFQTILTLFGKNAKEAEKSKSSMDNLNGAIDSVTHTTDRLNKKPILESLTPQALSAKATAFSTITSSLSQALDDVEKEIQNRNTADVVSNWISGLFGKNTEERITQQLVDVIDGAVKSASTATQAEDTKKSLALALSLPVDASLEQIKKAAEKANPVIRKEISKVLDGISKGAERSTGSVKAFIDSLSESTKLYQDLGNSFKASDPLSKFAEDSSKKLAEFAKILDTADLPSKLALLSSASTDVRFLQLLPLDQAKQVLSISKDLKQINVDIAQGLGDIRALEDGRLAAQQKLDNTVANSEYVPILKTAVKEYDKLIDQARKLARTREADLGVKLLDAEKTFNSALQAGLLANIDRFQSGIEQAAKKARLELQKTNLQGITDPAERILAESKLEKTGIALDNELLKSQIGLIQSNDNLRLAIQQQTYTDKLGQKMQEFGVRTELEARARDPQLDREFRTLEVAQNIQDKTPRQLRAMVNQPGVSVDVLSAVQSALPTAQLAEGFRQQQNVNKLKSQQVDIGTEYKLIDADLSAATKQYDRMLEELNRNKSIMSEPEFMRQKAGIEEGKSLLAPAADVRREQQRGPEGQVGLAKAMERLDIEKGISKTVGDRARTTADDLDNLTKAKEIYGEYYTAQNAGLEVAKYDLEFKQASLDKDLERGRLTQDKFNSRKYLLDLEEAGLQRTNALLAEEQKYTSSILDIRTKIAQQGGESPETLAAQKSAEVARNSGIAGIERQFDATKRLLVLNQQLPERQLAYEDIFKNSFNSMADAMVTWAQTGKLSGKELFNSLIADLARYELKLQMMQAYKTARPGIGDFLTKVFTGVDATTLTGTETSAQFVKASGDRPFAKGGSFDYGIQAFAKGGAFTNQIVDSPTMFKFAKGTGLMGEAGPEAIMPLKRDNQGNLGVRVDGNSGGNTEVVVNNYSTSQATTQETTDSRGNRKIEVTIGDMTAGEISRSGSASQKAVGGTFGLKPQLIRR